GVIGDADLFARLEAQPILAFTNVNDVVEWLARAVAVKVRIVERDERESSLRMVLNVGHTVGHAVEQVSHYTLNHGEAVAIGMAVETEISVARGLASTDTRTRIRNVLVAHGLPVRPPNYELSQVFDVLAVDKKHGAKGWTFALPKAIGDVTIVHDVTEEEVRLAWQRALGHNES
ncbi:MAG: 3-dehydroquinate synthase, partial [Alicyclobacillus sp.]|nr:3-dehydroquinate synthase [Alicyclobacillus sp.]